MTDQKIITGDHAWIIVMDFCKKHAVHPSNANELFTLVRTIRMYEETLKGGDNNGRD